MLRRLASNELSWSFHIFNCFLNRWFVVLIIYEFLKRDSKGVIKNSDRPTFVEFQQASISSRHPSKLKKRPPTISHKFNPRIYWNFMTKNKCISGCEHEFPKNMCMWGPPKIPFSAIISGPSGSGISVLPTNMVLDIYKGASPECTLGALQYMYMNTVWNPVNKYVRKAWRFKPTTKVLFLRNSYPKEWRWWNTAQKWKTQRTECSKKNTSEKRYPSTNAFFNVRKRKEVDLLQYKLSALP